MNIKRCDRCNEEIIETGNWLNNLAETVQKAVDALTGKPNLTLMDANSKKEFDLCPACKKSLNRWMREKHPEETTEPQKTKKAYIIPEDAFKIEEEET